MSRRFQRRLSCVAAFSALVTVGSLAGITAPAGAAPTGSDGPVTTAAPYVKANGAIPSPHDAIRFCGANNRQQNEPSVAVDARQPATVVAGSNDYCTVQGAGGTWTGFYRSTNAGKNWVDSLLPGYPTDNSAEGQASPLHQLGITNAGDPVQAWDTQGRLFYMGNAFNRAKPQDGSVWVATYDQDAAHYVRTVLVSQGTPAVKGRFNDKTALEVDRGTASPHAGNVYAAFSLFQGSGNNEIYFVRSTDHGATFSTKTKISDGVMDNQDADITVTKDGTVYVTWRQFQSKNGHQRDAVVFAKSTDGGRSFTKPAVATTFDSFDAADTAGNPAAAAQAHEQAFGNADGPESDAAPSSAGNARDCGSGPLACTSGYTFFRHDTQPRVTADPSGDPNTVYVVYDATKPNTEVPSTSTYNTAPVAADGTLRVGQGAIYLTKTTNGGRTWSTPKVVDNESVGHQWFPDINADDGQLHLMWSDSRNDTCYSVQRPAGDCAATNSVGDHQANPAGGTDAYDAVSTNGGQSFTVSRLSTVSHQPNYEMFGNRQVPFQGDYNYVSSVGSTAFNVWTDNRDVKAGTDPREPAGDGFDVLQCRTQNADGSYGPDTCPNAGGLDQNIYGVSSS